MGVLGLTPFLQKSLQVCFNTLSYVPEVVKQLPDRLRGLAGKKIVIDGTLITQRLHFAQVPHNYRHVVGWYRLIKELEDSGVSAICVFDGKERSLAKAREAERRREVQRLAVARGSIELDRVKRLNRLVDVLYRFQNLDVTQKGRVSELLQRISSVPFPSSSGGDDMAQLQQRVAQMLNNSVPVEVVHPPPLDGPQEGTPEIPVASSISPGPSQEETKTEEEDGVPLAAPTSPEPAPKESTPTYNINEDDSSLEPLPALPTTTTPPFTPLTSVSIPPISLSDMNIDPISSEDLPEAPVAPHLADLLLPSAPRPPSRRSTSSAPPIASSLPPASFPANQTVPPLDRPFPFRIPDIANTEVPTSTEDITVATVAMLYYDFRDSVRKLASLTPIALDVQPSTDAEQQDARVEYSMTKSQIQLTADEAKLWEKLASSASDTDSPETESPEETLSVLSQRADLMSQSYQRRNNPPTTQTYDESKELLRAMGVPCMDTTGTYEAEALASSLVINGFADYVASEDTDVVIYEAPLIRNITNRNAPLMMLSGSEIRTALQLDRSAFIDFALLLGTDFSQRIKNVGPTRALKFIRQHKSIERVIEAEKKYTPRVPAPDYLAEVEVARLVFQTLPPVPDAKLLEQVKDEEGLAVILQRFGLGKLLMGDDDWDFEEALQGNYFSDNPSA
ncbi:PIN domain-like protein [Mycena latifolia]|nr:PIN domain-like protein [Mycena latifolia]